MSQKPFNFLASGFPSPADDFAKNPLDLNRLVIQNPASTFFMQLQGSRHQRLNIFNQDLLVIDRSAALKNSSLIVSTENDQLELKSLKEARDFNLHELETSDNFWGVVTHLVRKIQ